MAPAVASAFGGHLRCEIVEGHRYADEEPSWYAGQGQYAHTTDPETSGIHERPSGAFRLPEQRPAAAPVTNPYALTDPLATSGSHAFPGERRIPVRGPEYPTIQPTTRETMAPPSPGPAPPSPGPAPAWPGPAPAWPGPAPAWPGPAPASPGPAPPSPGPAPA